MFQAPAAMPPRRSSHVVPIVLLILGCACEDSSPSSASSAGGSEPERARGAPEPAPDAREAEDAGHGAKGLFYEVRGGTGAMYLLGSVHVATPDLYPLRPAIEKAFDRADALALEIPIGQGARSAAAQKLARSAKYPPGKSIESDLTDETQELFERHREEAGRLAPMIGRFEPWFAAIAITQAQLREHGYSPRQGIDRHFDQRAGDKERLYLETMEEQIAVFEEMDASTQDLMLRETLEELDRMDEMVGRTLDAWKRGDPEALKTIVLEMRNEKEYETLFERLFLERNGNMLETLKAWLGRDQSTFVVVGAGHLVGQGSLVELLEDAGYRVEPR